MRKEVFTFLQAVEQQSTHEPEIWDLKVLGTWISLDLKRVVIYSDITCLKHVYALWVCFWRKANVCVRRHADRIGPSQFSDNRSTRGLVHVEFADAANPLPP